MIILSLLNPPQGGQFVEIADLPSNSVRLKYAPRPAIPAPVVLNHPRPRPNETYNETATNARWYLQDDFGAGRKREREREKIERASVRARVVCARRVSSYALTPRIRARDTRWLSSLGANGMPPTLSCSSESLWSWPTLPALPGWLPSPSRRRFSLAPLSSFFLARAPPWPYPLAGREFSWWSREFPRVSIHLHPRLRKLADLGDRTVERRPGPTGNNLSSRDQKFSFCACTIFKLGIVVKSHTFCNFDLFLVSALLL